jgi:hypothetical protein
LDINDIKELKIVLEGTDTLIIATLENDTGACIINIDEEEHVEEIMADFSRRFPDGEAKPGLALLHSFADFMNDTGYIYYCIIQGKYLL